MSAYLTLRTKYVKLFSLSRNSNLAQEILENEDIIWDGETRLPDIHNAISSVDERIRNMERLLDARLIKRDFDEREYISEKEYLIELYELRGKLHLINTVLQDAVFDKQDIYFTYG